MSYRSLLGKRGEDLACRLLVNEGFTIIERNFHVSHDEIDIIAADGKYIVFAEVKTRAQTLSNKRFGRPAAAVNYQKRQKLLRGVSEYLRQNKPTGQPRIDVIEVYMPSIRQGSPVDVSTLEPIGIKHIKNAVQK